MADEAKDKVGEEWDMATWRRTVLKNGVLLQDGYSDCGACVIVNACLGASVKSGFPVRNVNYYLCMNRIRDFIRSDIIKGKVGCFMANLNMVGYLQCEI